MTFPVYNTKRKKKTVALNKEASNENEQTLANFRKLRAKIKSWLRGDTKFLFEYLSP